MFFRGNPQICVRQGKCHQSSLNKKEDATDEQTESLLVEESDEIQHSDIEMRLGIPNRNGVIALYISYFENVILFTVIFKSLIIVFI